MLVVSNDDLKTLCAMPFITPGHEDLALCLRTLAAAELFLHPGIYVKHPKLTEALKDEKSTLTEDTYRECV